MHKTGACLPKLGQADPLVQALVLDPGLPPEQLLAPARGCNIRQRGCNLSNTVGSMLRRRRSSRKKRPSAEAVCIRWPKVPLHEASVITDTSRLDYCFPPRRRYKCA